MKELRDRPVYKPEDVGELEAKKKGPLYTAAVEAIESLAANFKDILLKEAQTLKEPPLVELLDADGTSQLRLPGIVIDQGHWGGSSPVPVKMFWFRNGLFAVDWGWKTTSRFPGPARSYPKWNSRYELTAQEYIENTPLVLLILEGLKEQESQSASKLTRGLDVVQGGL